MVYYSPHSVPLKQQDDQNIHNINFDGYVFSLLLDLLMSMGPWYMLGDGESTVSRFLGG